MARETSFGRGWTRKMEKLLLVFLAQLIFVFVRPSLVGAANITINFAAADLQTYTPQ